MIVQRQYTTILVHVLLWLLLGFVLLTYTPLTWGIALPWYFWLKQICQFIILVVLFYANMYVMVPRLLLRNKTIWFILINLAIIVVLLFVSNWYDNWSNLPALMDEVLGARRKHGKSFDVFLLYTVLLTLGISTSIAMMQHWQKGVQLRQQLQQQQVSSELLFLKAQIHPHFFFNTLNNIYSLTYSDIEGARRALHKLSWMMRYLLYETRNDVTSLSNEIRFLKDYIELMRLRLNKHTTVVFEAPEEVADKQIAPMLLMTFVENAFKHGVSAVQPGEVKIAVQQNDDLLVMDVQNPVFPKNMDMDDQAGGIGLTNTIRRLKLLYKGRHQLNFGLTPEQRYAVHLEIVLS